MSSKMSENIFEVEKPSKANFHKENCYFVHFKISFSTNLLINSLILDVLMRLCPERLHFKKMSGFQKKNVRDPRSQDPAF